ncbi:MAG: nucleoside-diphosphate sugar epimerase/dehydratase [Pseudomonadota bacterium]
MVTDSVIIALSFYLALQVAGREIVDIRYRWYEYLWMIGVLLGVKLFIFIQTGLYKEIIRYVSMGFAVKIVKNTIFGSLIAVSIIHIVRPEVELAVVVVDWMASCILIGLSRFGLRYVQEGRLSRPEGKNTFLYGAGEHGAAMARHLVLNANLGHRVVGFIDDSPEKQGKKIKGISVVGDLNSLPQRLKEYSAEEMVMTFANPDGEVVRRVFRACREHGVRCRIVPGMNEVIAGGEVVRNIDIADLMRRPQRMLDKKMVEGFLRGRRVLITGAAGSIGTEIFRQVLTFNPVAVAALDHSEYALYRLDEEFAKHPLKTRCFFSLVDVKVAELVNGAIRKFKPDVVFHAAAYKHVPILEQDVRQAVLNNVKGLNNVVNSAVDNGVSMFVFVSTDKAVRPTNVMGATKRIGECIVQAANGKGGMRCVSVRFGNVLASSGSVVPKFIDQIKAGGPVTVTHPDVTRYFMLIPEAVELVLQAASIGEGGEVFVLDMGKPVRIAEMAEDLISLMGHVPNAGIPISFTGLRPGEKLHEELFFGEIERPTQFQDISVGRVRKVDVGVFERQLDMILSYAEAEGEPSKLKEMIRGMVPEYAEQKISEQMERISSL